MTRDLGTALLFITHDLGLAAERAEQLVVMYHGKVVESGPSREILENPQHPYSQRLVAAAPSLASRRIQSSSKSLIELDYVAPAAAAEVDLVHAAEDRAAKQAASGVHDNAIVVEVADQGVQDPRRQGRRPPFKAVDDVSFAIERGTTMALVGESGSGKSTVAKLLLRLEDVTSGQITIDGVDTAPLKGRKLLALRRKMQPVFQDPYGSLDPLRNIGNTIAEPLDRAQGRRQRHRGARGSANCSTRWRFRRAWQHGTPANCPVDSVSGSRWPGRSRSSRRSSSSMRRCPRSTCWCRGRSSRLLAELQSELGLTYLFITHDLAVVRMIADHVCVMQQRSDRGGLHGRRGLRQPARGLHQGLAQCDSRCWTCARRLSCARLIWAAADRLDRHRRCCVAFVLVPVLALSACTGQWADTETVGGAARSRSPRARRSSPTTTRPPTAIRRATPPSSRPPNPRSIPTTSTAIWWRTARSAVTSVLSMNPFTVRYTIHDGVTWSDGTGWMPPTCCSPGPRIPARSTLRVSTRHPTSTPDRAVHRRLPQRCGVFRRRNRHRPEPRRRHSSGQRRRPVDHAARTTGTSRTGNSCSKWDFPRTSWPSTRSA